MNDYETKQEARRDRFLARADAADAEANRRRQQVDRLSECMNGQPILIGHHSEKRHRRDIRRMDDNMRKSVELTDKAEYYRQKAAGVGKGGISSDDPEAVEKLQAKIANAELYQEKVKAANKIIKRKPKNEPTPEKIAELIELLNTDEHKARKLFEPDFCGRIGFASYLLTNNNANIRRMKDRLESLRREADRPEADAIEGEGYRIEEHTEENRLWFVFDEKPSREVCELMRSYGWLWSRQRVAWVRQLNDRGRMTAKIIGDKLDRKEIA